MTGVSGLRAVAEVRFSLPSDGRAGVADPDTYRGNPAMRLRVSNFFHCEFAGAPPRRYLSPLIKVSELGKLSLTIEFPPQGAKPVQFGEPPQTAKLSFTK